MEDENNYKKLWINNDVYTLVDKEVYPFLKKWKWTVNNNGYVIRTVSYRSTHTIKLHRLLSIIKYGEFKNNYVVDHYDGDKLNNSFKNLRIVTQSINIHKKMKNVNSTSKYIGVCFNKIRNKWEAAIRKDYVRHNLGYYNNEKEAAIARDKKAIELYGKYARLNFPELFSNL